MCMMRFNKLISKNRKKERLIKFSKMMIYKKPQKIIQIRRQKKFHQPINEINKIINNQARIHIVKRDNILIFRENKSSQTLNINNLLDKGKEINHYEIHKIKH